MVLKTAGDEKFMHEAIRLARQAADQDEVPIGAVIVHQDRIIARAHNQVELLKDPTAHAEMIALTQACHELSSKWLNGCTVYVTIEPCSMCAGALVLARIKRLVYGARDAKAGACGSVVNIINHPALNHRIEISTSVGQEMCGYLMTEFFVKKRAQGKK